MEATGGCVESSGVGQPSRRSLRSDAPVAGPFSNAPCTIASTSWRKAIVFMLENSDRTPTKAQTDDRESPQAEQCGEATTIVSTHANLPPSLPATVRADIPHVELLRSACPELSLRHGWPRSPTAWVLYVRDFANRAPCDNSCQLPSFVVAKKSPNHYLDVIHVAVFFPQQSYNQH